MCVNYEDPFLFSGERRLWIYGQLSAALRVAHIPTALLLLFFNFLKINQGGTIKG